MNNMIVKSSSSSMTTTNINGNKTVNADSESNFERTNPNDLRNNIKIRKKGHFDMKGKNGRFHKLNSMNKKKGFDPTERFLRKEQGNLEDGIRKDVMDVNTGDKKFKIDLHSFVNKIKKLKKNSGNTKAHFSISSNNILGHVRDMFAVKFGKGGKGDDSH